MQRRVDLEAREHAWLCAGAAKADESRGRLRDEPQDEFRTVFQRDRDRIVHSKAFRRLMHKTQVFLSPEGDHYRTRLTHTLEVAQIARSISRALNLNEDLTEAIAMGHDLGHTPFGHNGEAVLNRISPNGFRHNEQSLRVVDYLEIHNGTPGMNLTAEVRDGILNHTGSLPVITLEGAVVKISDRIAYINHDIDDAIRSGVIRQEDLPRGPLALFGSTHGERIDNMIRNVVTVSDGQDFVRMDDEHRESLDELRTYMFDHVYNSLDVKKKEDIERVEQIVTALYRYYFEHWQEIPDEFRARIPEDGVETAVKDHIAGMTDRFAKTKYLELFG